MDITKDIHSLTSFRRRSGELMKQLRRSQRPLVLTVKGQAAAVVQDAAAYQRLLDIASRADSYEGIRQGLGDARSGKGRAAREFFAEFKAKNGIRD
jgi:prevent-host-death family protein